MSDGIQLITVLAAFVVYAMGYSLGHAGGQIKAQREHLKFLRESSARADEEHLRLVEMFGERQPATPQPAGEGE